MVSLQVFGPQYGPNGGVTLNGVTSTTQGTITRIEWDWGDGTRSVSWFPASHVYGDDSTYIVQTTAYSSSGLSQTAYSRISISNSGSRVTVQIMATPISYSDGFWHTHAFMCIAVQVGSGPREQCFGFVPRARGSSSGPGMVIDELAAPVSITGVRASYSRLISRIERTSILQVKNEWNTADYELTSQNCIAFVDRSLEVIHTRRPARSPLQTPMEYVQGVINLNPAP